MGQVSSLIQRCHRMLALAGFQKFRICFHVLSTPLTVDEATSVRMADAGAPALNPLPAVSHQLRSLWAYGQVSRRRGAVGLMTTQVPRTTTERARCRQQRGEPWGALALSVRNWRRQNRLVGSKVLPALNETLAERRKSLVLNGGPLETRTPDQRATPRLWF
jgi:hypothetical protein